MPEIKVDNSKLEETMPKIEALMPEIKVDNSKLEETTPEIEAPANGELKDEELLISETGTIQRGELYTGQEAKKYKDKITNMLSNSNEQKLKLRSCGDQSTINFAIFTCNTTMCDGFENGVAEFYEGRRGGTEMEVTAPAAKTGYVFVGWVKLGTTPVTVGGTEVPVDVYRAIYAKVGNKFSTMLLEKQITNIINDDEGHEHYKADKDKWTTFENIDDDKKTIKITFGGCYHYVSFADIKYELGEDNVVDVETIARRGEWSETVTAPELDGYAFKEWKVTHTGAEKFDIYTAVYTEVE